MKHTEGKWAVGVIRKDGSRTIVAGPVYVATLMNWPEQEWAAEVEGNSFLVAGAPDLLRACKAIIRAGEAFEQDPGDGFALVQQAYIEAEAAVAKAKGEETSDAKS